TCAGARPSGTRRTPGASTARRRSASARWRRAPIHSRVASRRLRAIWPGQRRRPTAARRSRRPAQPLSARTAPCVGPPAPPASGMPRLQRAPAPPRNPPWQRLRTRCAPGVTPQLERALAFAQRQMRAARERLEEANPNVEAAAALAEESVDALNATAYALAKSRNDVQGGQSGSGFAEMMEQLAHLAQQQGGLNGEVQGLLSFAAATGGEVMDQLRALAAQQRALAEDLERLHGEGASQAAGTLAQEARDLARQLEAGRLDAQTIQRQERLYRRLLDAGRTLTGPEPDEQRERASRPASSDSVHVPALLAPGATGAGARVRYP